MASLIVIEDLVGPASLGRGGHTMYVLQWLAAFERLGHRVFFLEFLKEDPGEGSPALARYFTDLVSRWWRMDRAALIVEPGLRFLSGMDSNQVRAAVREASALVTLAAHYRRKPYPMVDGVRPRILVEQDPGYSHLWASGDHPAEVFGVHDIYFTVGGNIGTTRCRLPLAGIDWRPIWNPVVLDWWEKSGPVTRDWFTTIADWRSYGYLEFEQKVLGPKAEEFRKFIDLPQLAGEPIEIALNIDPDDPDLPDLKRHGWHIEDPSIVATPELYRDYVSGSAGEFSCTKGGYAGTHCGWFSDRSGCYLAAGRPVVLQTTGFADLLPTGEGLFSAATVEEAAEAIRMIRRDYDRHSAAARRIAREQFDSAKIARTVLCAAGIGEAR